MDFGTAGTDGVVVKAQTALEDRGRRVLRGWDGLGPVFSVLGQRHRFGLLHVVGPKRLILCGGIAARGVYVLVSCWVSISQAVHVRFCDVLWP